MINIWSTTLFALTCLLSEVCGNCINTVENPCNASVYILLNDHTRSVNYSDPNNPFLGDYSLVGGWYRSVSPAGGDMPLTAPDPGGCQTIGPIWLNGNLPTESENIVSRTACARRFADPCNRQYTVCIKNCTTYNVYHLPTAATSSDRYCFGSELPCPVGESSWTGYSPGCGPIDQVLLEDPIISYTVVETELGFGFCSGSTLFQCNITHNDSSAFMWVEWSVGNQVVKTETLPYTSLPSTLSTTELTANGITKYGFDIKCRMRPRNTENGAPGTSRSTTFHAGHTVNNTILQIKEGGPPAWYVVKFTIPFNCDHRCNIAYTCTTQINIEIPTNSDGTVASCAGQGNSQSEIVFERATTNDGSGAKCSVTVSTQPAMPGELTELRIPVYPKIDGRYDGNKELVLQMGTESIIEGDELWQNVDFKRAQVYIIDEDVNIAGMHCTFWTDPWVRTFDGRSYQMQRAGFFVLYRHETLPIEVQGYFIDKIWFSEVCGFAVRSAGDLYVVNYCGKRGFYSKLYQCDELSLKTSITNLRVISTSTTYTVTLPTGGRVELSRRRILIYPSVADYDRTLGLCGSMNNNANDDYKMNNAAVTSDVNTFAESWRVTDANSLFFGKIIEERNFNDTVFCGCDNSSIASCGYTESLENCISQGHEETDKLKRRCGIGKRKRDLSNTLVQDDDDEMHFNYDRNFNPPPAVWRNGWTQTTAQQYCENYFNNRNSIHLCENVKGVDMQSTIDVCVQNIYVSGGTNYTHDGLDLVISTCINEIGKNDTLRNMTETDSNGNVISVADSLLNRLCPGDCNDQGTCQKGECVCNGHYTGKDCSLDSNHVPTLQDLLYNGLCDLNSKSCNVTSVFGDMFINSTDLQCKLQVLKIDKTALSSETEHVAEFGTFQKIYCPVLESKAPYLVSIGVKNKITYSSLEYILVYDSRCWNCTLFNCTKLPMSCVIDENCYSVGEIKPGSVDYMCVPDVHDDQWTKIITSTSNKTLETSTVTTPSSTSTGTTGTNLPLSATNSNTLTSKTTTSTHATTIPSHSTTLVTTLSDMKSTSAGSSTSGIATGKTDKQTKDNILAIGVGSCVAVIIVCGIILFIVLKVFCKKKKSVTDDKSSTSKNQTLLFDTQCRPKSPKYDFDGINFSRPGSGQSQRVLSPNPTLNFDIEDGNNNEETSPVIKGAWGPVNHARHFNFEEMRPGTGTMKNTQIDPL